MASAFLYRNLFDSAVFYGDTGTTALSSLPLSNLRDPQPRVRDRWVPASCALWIDLGSVQAVSCVALISTSLGLAGGSPTVRARVSTDAGFATSAWDTGAIDPATSDAANGNVVLLHAASASGRFVRIDVADPAADALDIGRIVIGPLWRLTHGQALGFGEGRQILDRRERNAHTGAEFPVPAVVNPRQATFTLPFVTPTEATAQWRTMLATLGGVQDALWVPSDSLSLAETNLRSIWGAAVQPGESALITRPYHTALTRSFTLVERA